MPIRWKHNLLKDSILQERIARIQSSEMSEMMKQAVLITNEYADSSVKPLTYKKWLKQTDKQSICINYLQYGGQKYQLKVKFGKKIKQKIDDIIDEINTVHTEEIPAYFQGNYGSVPYADGTVANAGCGITSFSMIASALTQKQLTPDITATWAYNNGVSTVSSWDSFAVLAAHYGVPYYGRYPGVAIGGSADAILNALKANQMVICSLRGGYFTQSADGHYIALVGITSDGNIYVHDPSTPDRTGVFEPQVVFSNNIQYFIFGDPQE